MATEPTGDTLPVASGSRLSDAHDTGILKMQSICLILFLIYLTDPGSDFDFDPELDAANYSQGWGSDGMDGPGQSSLSAVPLIFLSDPLRSESRGLNTPPAEIIDAEIDDIRTEYHPASGLPTTTEAFEEYGKKADESSRAHPHTEPWAPFNTRADFELAELALEAALTARQVNALVKLITDCVDKKSSITIRNHADLKAAWETASNLLTPASTFPIAIQT